MTDNDDLLKELKTALEAEPSREFAAGVRARVSRSEAQARRMWWGLAAAATVTLTTVALWRPAVDEPSMVSVEPTQASAPAIASKTLERVAVTPRATPAPSAVVRREAAVARAAVTTSADEPRLEVITNQGAVLRQLWADHQRRPLVVADAEQVAGELSTKPIVVNPLVVPPIVVSEIGKPAGSGGATPIIRRAEATKETR